MATNDIFSAFLEDNPDMLYRALMPGGTNPFTNYWRSQYGRVYGDYMGGLGKQALAGVAPTQTFADYLSRFNWQNEWQALAPQQRGEAGRAPTRWNIPW